MNTIEPRLSDVPPTSAGSIQRRVRALGAALEERLIGCGALVERLLIGLLTSGHLLIEGAPGLAKTRAVKQLADGLDASFGRIQCTPDLMPADLTGTAVWRLDVGRFDFEPGPVFHSLVLVDEVNRAPPKVQSALLEAMAERQVTAGGRTHKLPDPFMVVATQNSIEHEGTFPLPEAQLDRFLLHVVVELPNPAAELRILDLVERETIHDPPPMPVRLLAEEIVAARREVARIHLSPALKDYIVRLVTAPRLGGAAPEICRAIAHPASPRGTLALALATKAKAYLAGRDYGVPDDVAGLAADALAHRTILTWRAVADGLATRAVIAELLRQVRPL